jgi:hypothetical protein
MRTLSHAVAHAGHLLLSGLSCAALRDPLRSSSSWGLSRGASRTSSFSCCNQGCKGLFRLLLLWVGLMMLFS